MSDGRRATGRVRRAAFVTAMLLAATSRVRAQLPILLEGVGDGEFWSTTRNSNLLTRDAGRESALGRVSLWGAVEPLPGLIFFAAGRGEFGAARADTAQSEAYMEQFGARYAFGRALVLDAGKIGRAHV